MAGYRILWFFIRSIIIGSIVAGLILILVPDLRVGTNLTWQNLFAKEPQRTRLSYFDAIANSAPSVVNIYSISVDNNVFSGATRERTNLGSGVIMTESGYLLTCYHVIRDAASIFVALQDSRILEASIVGHDVFTDLAVLKIKADDLLPIPQLDDPNIRSGDVVMAIGNPYNLGQTITQGIVSRTGRNGLANYVDFIQTDAVLNQGNSGGALVDSEGYLVGITNANFRTYDAQRRIQNVDGINFAVPYPLAYRVMQEIISEGKVTRGHLGFAGNEFPGRPGITIASVMQNGPAELAGLRANDVVLAINGIGIESASSALDFIAETPPGTELQLAISRNGEQLNKVVIVGDLNNTLR